jgi:hypothetical protein
MINLRSANNKLIARSMELIKTHWSEKFPGEELDERVLYHYLLQNLEKIKTYNDKGLETPSIVQITFAMLCFNQSPDDFDEVASHVKHQREKGFSLL